MQGLIVDLLFLTSYHEEDSSERTQNKGENQGNTQENSGTNPGVQWKEIPRMQLAVQQT